MLFNSLHFLLFFPVVTLVYFVLPHRARWFQLLIASCYFYMAFIPVYLLILAGTIVVDYFAGIYIERARGARRRLYLLASIVANVGVLAVFKYYNFLNANADGIAAALGFAWQGPYLDMVLPIGLSFHTFQAMSYTIEVYRGNQRAEHHFGIYALYVMFYPQLVAGPIERPQNLLPQFHARHTFDAEAASEGLRWMLLGFVKKVVIADRIAPVVDRIYGAPGEYSAPVLVVATMLFAVQIYADFSGYSDIAVGSARVMGIRLMENFRRPYLARSVSEFWRRWHMSLSTWFRDYVYVPLGGSRSGVVRRNLNLLITFLLSGLWHGASWTYVVWGGLNGFFLVIENLTGRRARTADTSGSRLVAAARALFQTLLTSALICLTWVFFRAHSLGDALLILERMTDVSAYAPAKAMESFHALQMPGRLAAAVGAAAALIAFDVACEHLPKGTLARWPRWRRWTLYYVAIALIFVFGVFGEAQFIYFQF